jgi:hypothetical protein
MTTPNPTGTDIDAEVDARLAALAGLSDAYLQCRAIGHDDEIVTGYGVKTWDEQLGAQVIMRSWAWLERNCNRCGRQVLTTYDQFFLNPRNQPRYPEGYLFKGLGRGKPSEARRVFWNRKAGAQPPE